MQGRLRQVAATYEQVAQVVQRPEVLQTTPGSLFYYFGLGYLLREWNELDAAFDGLTVSYEGDDITVLRGHLVDEAALHGILIKVRDLTLPLLALSRVAAPEPDLPSP